MVRVAFPIGGGNHAAQEDRAADGCKVQVRSVLTLELLLRDLNKHIVLVDDLFLHRAAFESATRQPVQSVVYPGADDDISVGKQESSLTVLQVVRPLALVDSSTLVAELADAVSQALLPVALVHRPI